MKTQGVLISKEELFLKPISYCSDTFRKKAYTIETGQALKEIKEGEFRDIIEKLRDQAYPEDVKIRMKKSLKSYIFGGVFSYRNQESLLEYSKLCILDFDDIGTEKVEEAKSQLLEDPYICAAWISPKGAGLKALVTFEFTNLTEELLAKDIIRCHKYAYTNYKEYLCDKYSYPLDESGSDVTRLCYASFDPDIGIKDKAYKYIVDYTEVVLSKTSIPKKKNFYRSPCPDLDEETLRHIQRNTSQSARRIMKSIIKYLSKRELSITNTEREWYIVGQAIANIFSFSIGKEYYLKLCRLDGRKHDEEKSIRKIIDCYAQSRLEEGMPFVGVQRIMQFAQNKGWRGGRGANVEKKVCHQAIDTRF